MQKNHTRLYTLLRRQRKIRSVLIVILIIVVILIAQLWSRLSGDTSSSASQQNSTGSATPTLTKGTPDYKTFLPAGKTAESLGGWTRVSPPSHNAVYAYVDRINGTTISVSQQPLPEEFTDNAENQLEKFAKENSLNRSITAGDITVYLGISIKGPQSVAFIKDSTLIFIKSSIALADDQWIRYIASLK